MDASLDNSLIRIQSYPMNAESDLGALASAITPTESFYIRCNFAIPDLEADSWSLEVRDGSGGVRSWTLADLQREPAVEVTATIECAGNGRTLMQPVPSGTPWGLGAAGTATFRGVPLRRLLEGATGHEVLFRGFDGGEVEPGRNIEFERSLPLEEALRSDVLLAWEMNGETLTREHGYPVRLVVPGYYGIAWVKWLRSIEVIDYTFAGHFQAERYIYRNDPTESPDAPVTRMRVRALITSPGSEASLQPGVLPVRGIAWSGFGRVSAVDISTDEGNTWTSAVLDDDSAVSGGDAARFAAVQWSCSLPVSPGLVTILARATDDCGNTQPLESVQNELGYGNNVVHRVQVHVEPDR